MSPQASARGRRMRGPGCKAARSGSLEDVTPPRRIARRTTSMSSSWRNTRSALGVGHVWACLESVAQGLAAKAGDGEGAAGQGGQSEASAKCCAELGGGEGEAVGGWECLEPRGGAGAGHAAKLSLCNLYVRGAAVQASE
jgi:hypothetical protein